MDPKSRADPFLEIQGLAMGQPVEITGPDGRVWHGTLVPRHELSGDRIIQLKLENGYNVGIRIDTGTTVRVVEPASEPSPPAAESPAGPGSRRSTTPRGGGITLLTTGGTIASRVDYRTGGVRPVRDEREILAFYPELASGGDVHIEPVLDRLSEEITPDDWEVLAARVVDAFGKGSRGVVIAHGTDTLGFTAAALSFLLEELQGPVVLVGAQRSPDRPSSDGVSNLAAAVRIARETDLGEVVVVMHADLSDDRFAIHRGNRVRKMHSSRRDAFHSRNGPPLGTLGPKGIEFAEAYRPRNEGPTKVSGRLDPRASIVWFHPGLEPDRVRTFVAGQRGVVLAGTGLGHVSSVHLPWIREMVARGVVVAMTTQCLEGEADPYVYATGRQLMGSGVLFLHDLLPEVALVKMLWALGQTEDPAEAARLLTTERAGEFTPRHQPGTP